MAKPDDEVTPLLAAEVMRVSPVTVKREWRSAKARLPRVLAAVSPDNGRRQ